MGKDKALLPFLEEPLISRVIQRLSHLADEVLVTTNHPEDYKFLNLPLFPDLVPGRGALGGLYTALSAASHPLVGIVACDMPFASPELLKGEREILIEDPGLAAVIPAMPGGNEPFHAVYRKAVCLPAVQAALDAGKWRADSWWGQVRLRMLSPEEVERYDPGGRAFWNVNTPDELAQAEQAAMKDSNDAKTGAQTK